jgi:hypothetical protein
MAFSRYLFIAAVTAAPATPCRAQNSRVQSQVVGTWLLESIVDTLPSGSLAYWMGRRPTGATVYSTSGHMSVQFMRDPQPVLPARVASGTDAQRLAGARPFESLSSSLTHYSTMLRTWSQPRRGDARAHGSEPG